MQHRPSGNVKGTSRTLIAMAAIAAVLAIGLPQSSAFARPANTALPPDLARAWNDYNQATIRKDVAKLATLVTDDYVLVNSDATVQDKKSYLADFKAPDFKLEPYEIEQPLQKMLGNTALTGGVFNLGWTQGGRHQTRRLRFVHVWSRNHGRWRIAYTQLTRVPQ